MDVSIYIQTKGITSSFKDEEAVESLLEYERKVSTSQDLEKLHALKHEDTSSSELRREIAEDPEAAIKTNAEFFDRKFEIQRRQIEADIARAVRREGDRIISAVTSGPHDRIVDTDVYTFWKDMGWKGSVKARHFVSALRDYYQEKALNEDGQGLAAVDNWALDFISPSYTQQIKEAFDDDVSGFITVQEVNRLTQFRPRDWSLPHWMAYWAIGWQTSAAEYCEKIDDIYAKMFYLVDKVKPMNRRIVDEYLVNVWQVTMAVTFSMRKDRASDALKARFQHWVTAEEDRLKKNLEEIRYDIDSTDTVRLITGPGRIEMFAFPLIYLILTRHLEILSLGRTNEIAKDELADAAITLILVAESVLFRFEHVQRIFEQKCLDVSSQFKTFASGMFLQMNETGIYFGGESLKKLPDPRELLDEPTLPSLGLDPKLIFNYPIPPDSRIDYAAFDTIETNLPRAGTDAILGQWACVMFDSTPLPVMSKLDFTIEKDFDGSGFHASGARYDGADERACRIECQAGAEIDGFVDFKFKAIFQIMSTAVVFDGKLDVAECSIRGSWKLKLDGGPGGQFVCKRSQEFLRLYSIPLPNETPAQTRWKFALDSVRYHVKRNLWSRSFFLERLQNQKRYIALATRAYHFGKDLTPEEAEELQAFFKVFTTNEIRFCASVINKSLSTSSVHTGISCDRCQSILGCTRIICMDCRSKSSIDFCEDPACAASTIGLDVRTDLEKPHAPSHEVFKVHAVLHGRRYAMIEKKAKQTLKNARALLRELDTHLNSENVGNTVDLQTPMEAENPAVFCSHCKEPVYLSPPCWACIECAEFFICDSCDAKSLSFTETHTVNHAIVRCQPAAREVSTEERLIKIEAEVAAISTKMQARLTKMESMLKRVLGKLEREEIPSVDDVKDIQHFI